MSINVNDKNLGHATAYAYYKAGGGTMTEAEFTEFMADFGTASQTAVEAAQAALASKNAAQTAATTATNKASEATTAATTATNKAAEAQADADAAALDASQAMSAASTATTKASEATTAAATATSAKTDAVAANTAAQSAKTAAQTAQTGAETAAASVEASAEQIQTNADDISELKEDLTHAFPHDTVSGAVASFSDGADDVPMDSVIVNIEPVQSGSGDPSPDNVRPISGWSEVNVNACGVNVWDGTYEAGKWINDSSTGEVANAEGFNLTDFIPVVPGETYYGRATGSSRATWFDANKNALGMCIHNQNATFTVPANARYVRFTITDEYLDDFYINYPSTDHDYHPYSGQSINIPLGQTVYGGKLDVVSGELVIDRAMVDMGTLAWNKSNANTGVFFCNASDWTNAVASRGIMCPIYTTYTGSTSSSAINSVADKSIMVNKHTADYPDGTTGNYAIGSLLVKDSAYSDAATFKTAMSGVMLCYPLATPLTIQLTPHEVTALLGSNNIWADSGDSAVEYRADPTLYIQRLTEPDADMVADANITSGSYFMVGNTLYKATANIASGGAITPNGNCTRKSLSEALNEINA